MKIDNVYLAGIGTADTELLDVSEAVDRGWYDAEARERGALVSVSVAGETPAPDLAVQAANRALALGGHSADEIGAVFHTCVHPQGPDGWSAQHYINHNTIDRPVTSAEIRNGCTGFFASLQLASCFLASGTDSPAVLLTCGDNFSTPSIDRWRACGLFVLADAGGSVVLSRTRGFARLLTVDAVAAPELEILHRGATPLYPPTITLGRQLDFNTPVEYINGKVASGEMPPQETDFATILIEATEQSLKNADVTMDEIALVVHDGFHYDTLRDLYFDPLGIGEEKSLWSFMRLVGHAGVVDHIRGLEHAWKEGLVSVGDRVLLAGGTPGMEAASAVVEILEPAPAQVPDGT
ncbi:ketoacyl-ACP synthase III family protein [Actinomadura graeca]|uniref:Ketoacyl-ACP synthase III family protein n=1 Tax=Actinomadura graeca TaxID=2750812 RepID=A0ABX8QWR3_9ACTN|nr:ketoacyl-ACP synthase III family protein [Actinomadura graeca]QXJ22624.1 ketoacyl-ACP synthase III family protein [Actinomadura graeca]